MLRGEQLRRHTAGAIVVMSGDSSSFCPPRHILLAALARLLIRVHWRAGGGGGGMSLLEGPRAAGKLTVRLPWRATYQPGLLFCMPSEPALLGGELCCSLWQRRSLGQPGAKVQEPIASDATTLSEAAMRKESLRAAE
ncbi:hypothetical protein BBAD15_g3655 [Beauveria bassiana D1-5]|uniref:Uncharacterized protein n=1 Tax=Beauveria bassiana D1-5 TaxID=1245745 RepID=A0A0A2VXT6_BEABA|nr:hypothetical protein BBAD15_g3655 [Beauveria bassiana D1-5]